MLKTAGLTDVLRSALQDERIQVAFVFGSITDGKETADSDLDLFVIGQLGLRGISELLSGISEKIGREINPHVMSVHAFRKRIETGEHFISRVMESPKLFILGTENDLNA